MNIINEYTINFLWDMFFILIASSVICFLLNGTKKKRETIKTVIVFLITLILNFMLGIIQSYCFSDEGLGKLLLGYEIICWIFIIETLIVNKKHIKIILNKTEKILILISMIIGILLVICLCKSNIFYVSPMKNEMYLGNYYFNADTHRSIEQMSTAYELTHKIHPLYSFILLPIMLPVIIINHLLQGNIYNYYLEIVSAYIICFIQILCNAASTVVFYRILKAEKLNNKIATVGTSIFTFSISIIWSSILPETYAIATLAVLMFIYLYQKRNVFSIVFAIFAIGANIITIVPIGLILVFEIFKLRKKLKKFIPIGIFLILIGAFLIAPYLFDYITEWMYKAKSVSETFIDSINYFLIPLLFGPNFIKIGSLFVQINTFNPVILVFFICFFFFAICGYVSNLKKIIPNICMLYLLVAYILHVVLGYGFVNGILYSPLYCWPYILLISLGVNYIFEKVSKKKILITILIFLISTVLLYNISWVLKLGNYLKDEKFNTGTRKSYSTYIYLKNGNYFETFYCTNRTLYRCSDGKAIIQNIDLYVNEEDYVVGLLKDSNWFKIYFENGELKLNISNKIQTIEKDNFYIFGMGLREKYILTKGDNLTYRLIAYKNGQEILSNLYIEKIDYENYTIYFDSNIKIYENEHGIYIEDNGEIKILDDSIYINIPNYNAYEHKEQLKILFNEVMVNITEEGPKPNFIAYDEVWYRDATIVAKVLQETDNLEQIYTWLNNLDKMYDEQNGLKEADNLGQVLYLISLTENKNENLINKIIQEAEKLKTEEGYIEGYTDGSKHPVYQTKWLIYGMNELGLDTSQYKVPKINDSYSNLLWFDRNKDLKRAVNSDRWQYLYYATLHHDKVKIDFKNTLYPISNEIYPSKANFEKMSLLNNNFSNNYIVTPHSWSAAEMFLYLLELDRGNI